MGLFLQLLRLLCLILLLSQVFGSSRFNNLHFTMKDDQGRISDKPKPSPPPPFSKTSPIPAVASP
ncbi:hypothetical protein BVC80_441g170 [Macleaya cordata]|uniref:Uncharacterized protein n=1 Tax=Macleaya cordata TaxID=56857 RepID=A0A200Q4R1_MACCD|nr:hypothetical protein BVC80_441g170 [Macleaya cordata]